jgi:hypothetical protein
VPRGNGALVAVQANVVGFGDLVDQQILPGLQGCDSGASLACKIPVTNFEREYPSAAAWLAEDLPALCVHLKYFPRLRKRFRASKPLERSLAEVRRRTKVIGRFPGETSCLSLCWAILDILIAGARGLGLSDLEYRPIVQLKKPGPQGAWSPAICQ